MRSQYEQHDSLKVSAYRELQILSEVDNTPDVTQRLLSNRVGIALGLTNVLLRNLVQKGYIRVSNATWKRRLYTVTPEGFLHRAQLMVSYVHRVLNHYQRVRHTLREQLEPLALNAESRVAIYGTEEFAELVYLGLREIGIEEIDVYGPPNKSGTRFLGMPVHQISALRPQEYDRVAVAVLSDTESICSNIEELGVGPDRIVTFFTSNHLRHQPGNLPRKEG